MKKILFLFMLIGSNVVFADDKAVYFPNELRLCSSCIMKLPKELTKTEYCSKGENKDEGTCEGNETIIGEIHNLDAFSDCKVKSYNSVIEKFIKRNIKVVETSEEDMSVTEDLSAKYESNETYKVTICLYARYGKLFVYKNKQETSQSDEE